MSSSVHSQRLSAMLRAGVVLAVGGIAVGWLFRVWWRLGRDFATTGWAAGLVDEPFESLVAEVAGVMLLVAITALASSACLAALESLALTVAGQSFGALSRVSRGTGPAWWRRVVLLLCGAGLCTCVTATASHAGEHSPGDVCQVDCIDLDGLSLPDLPARTAVPPGPRPAVRESVVVSPGDCLWDIARAELGPRASDAELEARVDAWYTHNRATLGPDPDLIFPGTQLELPEAQT